jgi:adenosylcobyric acid synthase
LPQGTSIRGYEIHLGETEYLPEARPFASVIRRGSNDLVIDGATANEGGIFGTYLHGLFDDDGFRHSFLQAARARCGLAPASALLPINGKREQRIDRLAAEVRHALNMDLIYRLLEVPRNFYSEKSIANETV